MRNFCWLVLSVVMLSGCFPSNTLDREEVLLQGRTMGTTYNIKIIISPQTIDIQLLQDKIDSALKGLNQEMSTYIADSELSLFNKISSTEPVEISVGLSRVIKEAIRLGELTGGKLDVTVGPLVNLWGFGPENKPDTVPDAIALSKAKNNIGIKHIKLSENLLSKAIPELYVDLSTIAKGYGVDLVAELLEKNGINNYLAEIGGEMRLKGFKHTGELWVVAVEKPISTERAVQQAIVPQDNAVATSGDYRNYFEVDGQRFSHIIDPETGKPINHKLVSVTVIHPSSMTADGLSTAMMVMGTKDALAFAQKNGIAAYLISKSDNGFVEQSTVKFRPYLK